MANSSDGLSWGETTPGSADPRKDGAAEILGLRKGVRLRLNKEHVALVVMSAGPDLATGGGEHKAGSAMAYFQDADPTQRPDAATTLTAADDGRLFVDTTGTTYVLKVYEHSPDAEFKNVSGVSQANGTETRAAVSAGVTITVGFIPDLFWFMFGTDGGNNYGGLVSLSSKDPTRMRFGTAGSDVYLNFTMNGTNIDISVISDTGGLFAATVVTYWRALKF